MVNIPTKADAIGHLESLAHQYPGRRLRALDRFRDEVGSAKVDPGGGRPAQPSTQRLKLLALWSELCIVAPAPHSPAPDEHLGAAYAPPG
jgi:hypothetical protein